VTTDFVKAVTEGDAEVYGALLATAADPGSGDFTARREKGHRRPRGYAEWRPQRKTRELISCVEEIIVSYEDFLPLTVRQLFYLLVAGYGYEKTDAAYGRLSDHLVRARRARMIPFDVIRDDGVVTYSTQWHDGPDAFWDETGDRIRKYRRDRQAGQRAYVELWCEAKGMAPQLARVANKYSVPVFSAGGFGSLTSTRLVADRALERSVPTVLLHVGDLDPSGEDIFDALAEDAALFVEADRSIMTTRVEAERVALTHAQVTAYGLPTAPPKKNNRGKRWEGETCQLEALPPNLLAELIEDAIAAHFNPGALERQIAIEEEDRATLYLGLPEGSG
jgi:hypothetical protein